jgi:hypothetical protein
MKGDEMGRGCGMHESDLFGRKPEKRDHLEYLSKDGRVILKCILKIGWEDVDWINLVQDRDQWKDFLNIVSRVGGTPDENNGF